MKKVELNYKEMDKYKVIKNVVSGRTTKRRAAILLSCSLRTIDRLVIKYKLQGKAGFIHGNRNKESSKRTSLETRQLIYELYQSDYYDFSLNHFNELLKSRHNINISYPTLRSILNEFHIISNYAHKKTRKIHKKRLRALSKNKSDGDVLDLVKKLEESPIISIKEAHPRQPRPKYHGEIIEMDACLHLWFGQKTAHLHGAIDVSTGKILGLYFSKEETLNSYYQITKQMIENYGIPAHIKTDNRTIFKYVSSRSKNIEKDTYTQYSYMCKSLGIKLTSSSVPESKAHIERLWGTLQKRLVPLMRQAQVCCTSEANVFIQQYIIEYNEQFAIQNDNIISVFENEDEIIKNINKYLSVISKRIVDKGHSIKYNNKYYYFAHDSKQEYIAYKTEILVIKDLYGNLMASVDNINKLYDLVEIPNHKKSSPEFDIINEPSKKEKRTYRPPANHPWRKFKFSSHVNDQSHVTYSNY